MSHQPKFYFFDNGITRALLGSLQDTPNSTEKGRLFEQWILQEVVRLNEYQQKDWKLSFWRTSHGAEVDILISRGTRLLYAIECKFTKQVTTSHLSGLKSFHEKTRMPLVLLFPLSMSLQNYPLPGFFLLIYSFKNYRLPDSSHNRVLQYRLAKMMMKAFYLKNPSSFERFSAASFKAFSTSCSLSGVKRILGMGMAREATTWCSLLKTGTPMAIIPMKFSSRE